MSVSGVENLKLVKSGLLNRQVVCNGVTSWECHEYMLYDDSHLRGPPQMLNVPAACTVWTTELAWRMIHPPPGSEPYMHPFRVLATLIQPAEEATDAKPKNIIFTCQTSADANEWVMGINQIAGAKAAAEAPPASNTPGSYAQFD